MIELFPRDASGWLVWAHLVLAWCLAHYALHVEPVGSRSAPVRPRVGLVRPVTLGVASAALLAPDLPALITGIAVAAASLVHTWGRARIAVPRHRSDVWEVCAAVGIPVLLAALTTGLDLSLRFVVLRVPATDATVAQALWVGAAFLLVTRGGSHFVRGVLDRLRIGTTPGYRDDLLIETRTLAVGRMIGELERALLLLFALDGSYAAAGFLVAAKSFVRAREATDPKFAEYVVIGTLASFLFAALVAGGTRLVLSAYG